MCWQEVPLCGDLGIRSVACEPLISLKAPAPRRGAQAPTESRLMWQTAAWGPTGNWLSVFQLLMRERVKAMGVPAFKRLLLLGATERSILGYRHGNCKPYQKGAVDKVKALTLSPCPLGMTNLGESPWSWESLHPGQQGQARVTWCSQSPRTQEEPQNNCLQ